MRLRQVLQPPDRAQHRPGRPRQRLPTSTTWRLATTVRSCAGPASRSSQGSTSINSGSGPRSTSSSTTEGMSTSPAASRRRAFCRFWPEGGLLRRAGLALPRPMTRQGKPCPTRVRVLATSLGAFPSHVDRISGNGRSGGASAAEADDAPGPLAFVWVLMLLCLLTAAVYGIPLHARPDRLRLRDGPSPGGHRGSGEARPGWCAGEGLRVVSTGDPLGLSGGGSHPDPVVQQGWRDESGLGRRDRQGSRLHRHQRARHSRRRPDHGPGRCGPR